MVHVLENLSLCSRVNGMQMTRAGRVSMGNIRVGYTTAHTYSGGPLAIRQGKVGSHYRWPCQLCIWLVRSIGDFRCHLDGSGGLGGIGWWFPHSPRGQLSACSDGYLRLVPNF